MKKVILPVLVFVSLFSAKSQVFVENFATATINGNLEGYNEWYVSAKAADALGVSPKIAEGALFYTGYAGSNIGNVAVLDSAIGPTTSNQRISTRAIVFANGDSLKPVEGQKIYAAFMVNFSNHSYRSQRDFFTFEGSKTSSMTRGRVFAKINTAGTDVTFALSKNSSTSGTYVESAAIANGVGINHLLVAVYESVAGADNDLITLYIDPDLSLTEAQQTNKLVTTDAATDYSVTTPIRINLRQRGTGAQIGGIRVGKSWNSVVLGINSGFENLRETHLYISGKSIITGMPGKLQIYNLAGSLILTEKTEGRLKTKLERGMYMIKFVDNTGKISAHKIQIN